MLLWPAVGLTSPNLSDLIWPSVHFGELMGKSKVIKKTVPDEMWEYGKSDALNLTFSSLGILPPFSVLQQAKVDTSNCQKED